MITKENLIILLGFILGTLIAAGIIFFIVIGINMYFGGIPITKDKPEASVMFDYNRSYDNYTLAPNSNYQDLVLNNETYSFNLTVYNYTKGLEGSGYTTWSPK